MERYVTDISRWQRPKGSDADYNKFGVFNPTPTWEIYANNIWRNYTKKDMSNFLYRSSPFSGDNTKLYNEALAAQSGEENPINGIFLIAEKFSELTTTDKQKLLEIIEQHPQYNLFIYDIRLKEHIMRKMTLEEARLFLSDPKKTHITTEDTMKLEPFKGFTKQSSPQQGTTLVRQKFNTNLPWRRK